MLPQIWPVSRVLSTYRAEITSLEASAPLAAGRDPRACGGWPRALCFRQHGAGPGARSGPLTGEPG